ncbi:hypothetical protein, partial [Acinetobacter sp. AGC35]
MLLDNQVLEDAFESVKLGEGSQIQLVSPEGTVIASSLREEDGAASKYSFIKESKTNNSSQETADSEGRDVLAVYDSMERADWKLAGVVPTSELVREARPILATTFIAAAAAALLAILLGI